MSLRSSGNEKMNFFNRWHQNYAQVHRRQIESRQSIATRWHFPGRRSQMGPEWTTLWRRPREVKCATTSEAEHVSKKSGDQKCFAKRSETLLEKREKRAIILALLKVTQRLAVAVEMARRRARCTDHSTVIFLGRHVVPANAEFTAVVKITHRPHNNVFLFSAL